MLTEETPLPEWLRPPQRGHTAEDLDRIPDLPPHTELIDGSLVFAAPQDFFRMAVLGGLADALRGQAPEGLLVVCGMTMTLAPRQRPEPDLSVVSEAGFHSLDQTDLPVAEARLVVEVVSRESEIRDRERKPQLYAAAGIPDFWLVEEEDDLPVVHAHDLAPDGTYRLAALHRGRLTTSRPFPIDIDLTDLAEL